jgi:AcrR family transcriptional regulator
LLNDVQSTTYGESWDDVPVPADRTGGGDPERTIDLLWHAVASAKPARGPRRRLAIGTITAAAVELADAEGIAAVTMRGLASRLGLASPMALYTYVPAKAELVDLMVDACCATFSLDVTAAPARLAERVCAVANANRGLYRQHPWLADVSTERPPLGPGQLRKYERELAALDGLGLSDHEMDLTLTLVITFVRADAASAAAAGSADEEAAWWAVAGPALARYATAGDYPLASRVGTTAGEAQGRAYDPDLAYTFGLERIADGVEALRRRTHRA